MDGVSAKLEAETPTSKETVDEDELDSAAAAAAVVTKPPAGTGVPSMVGKIEAGTKGAASVSSGS